MTRDPVGFDGGINLYAYVGNGVVVRKDLLQALSSLRLLWESFSGSVRLALLAVGQNRLEIGCRVSCTAVSCTEGLGYVAAVPSLCQACAMLLAGVSGVYWVVNYLKSCCLPTLRTRFGKCWRS